MNEKKITAKIQEDENVEGVINLEPLRGPNGYSAYELYVKNLPEGETPLTELEWLNSISKVNYYKQYKQTTITTEANTTIIPINISEYNETCLLEVFLNGLRLDNTEYTINSISKQVVLENPISTDQTVHLIVTKTIVATENDYDLLKGEKGADGADGLGVPAGGTTGQVLAKQSDADNDTKWVDQTGGNGNVDDTLNIESTNPIQNKTVTQAINKINEIFYNEEGEWTLDEDYEESE